jgi:uncharacterized membrane protein
LDVTNEAIGAHRIAPWLQRAWQLVSEDLPGYMVVGFLVGGFLVPAVLLLVRALPFVSGPMDALGFLLLLPVGPLLLGLHLVLLHKLRTGTTRLALLGEGFTATRLPHALLACLVVAAFTLLGGILCLLPGFLVAGLYTFTFARLADGAGTFWDAMEESRRGNNPHLWTLTLLQIVLLCINVAGVMACGIGVTFTIPFSVAAVTVAYQEIQASPGAAGGGETRET